jgi:DNA-binding MarR family transcriptional regulator
LTKAISRAEYQTLAEFRYQLASFLRRRRSAAQDAGIEPQQYELMLAVKGLPGGKKPTIKQIAEQLRLQHHSAVELTTRLVERGLIRRERSKEDRRSVLLSVTKEGQRAMDQIVRYSLDQLRDEGPELLKTLARLMKRNQAK